MPSSSTFLAVQCSTCEQIQIQASRRDGRFRCKVCGEWQSTQKVLAKSARPQELRPFVQTANRARGEQSCRSSRTISVPYVETPERHLHVSERPQGRQHNCTSIRRSHGPNEAFVSSSRNCNAFGIPGVAGSSKNDHYLDAEILDELNEQRHDSFDDAIEDALEEAR